MHHVQLLSDTFGTTSGGVGHPFGSPWLIFVDTTRAFLLVLLGWNTVVAVRARYLRHTMSTVRMVTVVCFCWVVGETEADRVGFGVGHGGRLWLSVAAFVAITATLWGLSPARDRR